MCRELSDLGSRPLQWKGMTSAAGVLRGTHVHVRGVDYLVPAAGRLLLGLHDLGPWSPTSGRVGGSRKSTPALPTR
jgi:dTDP-4-dehydrorhamnose 3,5-epimerase